MLDGMDAKKNFKNFKKRKAVSLKCAIYSVHNATCNTAYCAFAPQSFLVALNSLRKKLLTGGRLLFIFAKEKSAFFTPSCAPFDEGTSMMF